MFKALLLFIGILCYVDLRAQSVTVDSALFSFYSPVPFLLPAKPHLPTPNVNLLNTVKPDSTAIDSSKKSWRPKGSAALENLYYASESEGPFPGTIFTTLTTTNTINVLKYPFQVGSNVVFLNGSPSKDLSSLDFGIDKEQLLNRSKAALEAKVKGAKSNYLESLLPGSNFIKDSLDHFTSLQSALKSKATAAATQYVEFVKDSLKRAADTLSSNYRYVDSCSANNAKIKSRYNQLLEYREKYNTVVSKHKDKLSKYDSLLQKVRSASNVNGLRSAFKQFASLDGTSVPDFKALDFVDGFNLGSVSATGNPLLIRNFTGNGVDFAYEKDKYFMQALAGWEKPFEARTFQLHRPEFKPIFPDKRLAYLTAGISGDESKTSIHALYGSWKQSANTLFSGTNVVIGLSEERQLAQGLTLNAFAATSTRWPKDQINESSTGSLLNLNNVAANVALDYKLDWLRTDFEAVVERVGSKYYTIGNPFLMRGTTLTSGKQKTRLTRWFRFENELAYKLFDKALYASMDNSVRRKHSAEVKVAKFSTTNLSYEKETVSGDAELGGSNRVSLIGTETIVFGLGKKLNAVTTATYLENRMKMGGIEHQYLTRALGLTQAIQGKKYTISASYMQLYQSDSLSNITASAGVSLNLTKRVTVAHTSTYTDGLLGRAYITSNTLLYGITDRLYLQTLFCGKYYSAPVVANAYGAPYITITITYTY
ncbi:MAG TPA: hypothetical protein VEY71_09620 [Chitinophagales bacterium]|nr:hypothetical protein [Chitinophagales bacterium]